MWGLETIKIERELFIPCLLSIVMHSCGTHRSRHLKQYARSRKLWSHLRLNKFRLNLNENPA